MLLVVDANVFVGELLRRRGRALMRDPRLTLMVSERALEEARHELFRRIEYIVGQERMGRETADAMLRSALEVAEVEATVVPDVAYSEHLEHAAYRVPRDLDDAPTVALALGGDEGRCGIWTNDGASSAAGSRRGPPTPCSRTCVTANAPNHKPTAPPYTRSYSRGVLRI